MRKIIEDRIKELGISRSELARRIGRKPQQLTRMLGKGRSSGERANQMQVLGEIFAALGLTVTAEPSPQKKLSTRRK